MIEDSESGMDGLEMRRWMMMMVNSSIAGGTRDAARAVAELDVRLPRTSDTARSDLDILWKV